MGNNILSDYNRTGETPSNVATDIYVDVATTFIHPNSGDVLLATDVEAIKNSIKNIVLTPIGTRPFKPEFGSSVTALLFELVDGATSAAIETEIKKSITRWEPRVSDLFVRAEDRAERNAYNITLTFSVAIGATVEVEFLLNRIR